jgi:uncharacterized coiled-coil protein SlyX
MSLKIELAKTFKNLLSQYFGQVYTEAQIKVSDKVVGGVVEMISADGTLSPATDGDYVMDNGFSFTVKDGVILSIVGEEPVIEDMTNHTDPTMTGETKMDITEDVKTVESSLFDLYNQVMGQEDKIKYLEEKVASMEDMLQTMHSTSMESEKTIATFNKVVDELNKNIKTLASVPVEFSKVDNTIKNNEEKQEKLNFLVNLIGKKSK